MANKIFDREGITDRVTTAFEESGLSQTQFAKDCEVSVSTAGRWLSGKTKNIPNKQRQKIADALGVTKKWLDTGKGIKHAPQQNIPKTMEASEYYGAELEMMESAPGLFKFLMDMEGLKEKAIGMLLDDSLSEDDRQALFKKMKKGIRKRIDWLQ